MNQSLLAARFGKNWLSSTIFWRTRSANLNSLGVWGSIGGGRSFVTFLKVVAAVAVAVAVDVAVAGAAVLALQLMAMVE